LGEILLPPGDKKTSCFAGGRVLGQKGNGVEKGIIIFCNENNIGGSFYRFGHRNHFFHGNHEFAYNEVCVS